MKLFWKWFFTFTGCNLTGHSHDYIVPNISYIFSSQIINFIPKRYIILSWEYKGNKLINYSLEVFTCTVQLDNTPPLCCDISYNVENLKGRSIQTFKKWSIVCPSKNGKLSIFHCTAKKEFKFSSSFGVIYCLVFCHRIVNCLFFKDW